MGDKEGACAGECCVRVSMEGFDLVVVGAGRFCSFFLSRPPLFSLPFPFLLMQ
jgi:hypothetical protein